MRKKVQGLCVERGISVVYGYMRVSSKEQNEDRQRVALTEIGVPVKNIYMDKQSGKDFERTQYKRMLRKLDENSVLYIKSIDRLGRNYEELNEQWRIITKEKKADIVVIDMPLLDTRREKNLLGTFISDIVLALLSYVAENERANIKQRQAEGIAAAKSRGVRFGRPSIPLPDNFEQIRDDWRKGLISMNEAAALCGICPKTFYYKAVKTERVNTDEGE
jgi:DNA invertase Pin-like site-specific DNA recombinase